jgi:hypothetical protein
MADDPTQWLGDSVGGIAGADTSVSVHVPVSEPGLVVLAVVAPEEGTGRRVDSQVKLTLANARGLLRAIGDGVARAEEHAE